MAEFQIDCTSLANKALIHQLKKDDPLLADMLGVFDKHDIWAPEAFAIMDELREVIEQDDTIVAQQNAADAIGDKLIKDLAEALIESLKNDEENKTDDKNNDGK